MLPPRRQNSGSSPSIGAHHLVVIAIADVTLMRLPLINCRYVASYTLSVKSAVMLCEVLSVIGLVRYASTMYSSNIDLPCMNVLP